MNEADLLSQENKIPEQKKKIKISKKAIFAVILVLSLAFNVLLFAKLTSINAEMTGNSVFLRYVSPSEQQLTDSNIQDGSAILHYNGLKKTIEQEIKENNADGKLGIFVQDIQTGAWLGINERGGFAPASLLKIPIMMAILKRVELGEMNINDDIVLLPEDLDKRAGNLYERGAGAKIKIIELLEEMITFSDNTAKNALKRQLFIEEIDRVFAHIGISNAYSQNQEQGISPRGMTRIFKSLYYHTFLSPKLSELALELTTDTQEENLISRGVPSEIQVAHKYGISIVKDNEVLHDCGIIYHPTNPYLLCIMTKNLELQKSIELIQKISKEVYEFVDKSDNN